MILSADKFGFYTVGDLKTYSKVEAIEWQSRTGHFPQWNFNKEVFESVNWYAEPELDLWTLYKQRAKQIRDNYDYCVLFYSGGSDSDNVLKSWIDAECKIDEVASFWNYNATKNLESFMCQEISRVVHPTIENLKKQHNFKYTNIDITELTIKFLQKHKFDYMYYGNHSFSPNNIVKSMFREEISHWQEIIDSGKKLCFIWGSEKPQIGYDHCGTYLQFVDIIDNCVSPYTQMNYSQGWYDELFYWTPDMPEILVKQVHTINNFVNQCDLPEFYTSNKTVYGYNKKIQKYVSPHGVKQIIYPKWNPDTFVNGKGIGTVSYSQRDEWLWNSNLKERDIMTEIIKQTTGKISEFWQEKSNVVKGHIQKHYFEKRG